MNGIFFYVLKISFSAGWGILVVLLFRFLLRDAPKWTHCLLWGMIGLRLLLPVSVPVPIRRTFVLTLQKTDAAVAVGTESGVAPGILGWVWLFGLIFLLGYDVVSVLRVRRKTQVSVPFAGNVSLCDDITTPFIFGVFRPRICLPSGMEAGEIPYVIRHEQAHLQRRDHWWKPLSFLLLAVYWFHPLIWLAYVIFNRDIELACDERSIRDLTAPDKKRYSEALMNCSIQRRKLFVCPVGFGELNVRERIGSVFSYRKSNRKHTVLAVALCVTLTFCFLDTQMSESGVGIDKEEQHGFVVSEWADEGSIDINANGISVEKMKCCPYIEDIGVELFYSLNHEESVYTTCRAKRLSHIHEYGEIYTTIKCKNCGAIVDAYYAGKGYRCPYEAQLTE